MAQLGTQAVRSLLWNVVGGHSGRHDQIGLILGVLCPVCLLVRVVEKNGARMRARVCRGFLPPVAVTQPCPPRFKPQTQPTSESYGGTSSPSHVWSSLLTTRPSSLLPRTAPLSSVSEQLGGGAAPQGSLGKAGL